MSHVGDDNSAEMRGSAKKCPHEQSCLATGRCGEREMCQVERNVGDNILFLKGELPSHCPYKVAFGYGHFCSCPVHSKLYREGKKTSASSAEDDCRGGGSRSTSSR